MTPELLRLMAYCGNAGARKALSDNPCRCVHSPCRTDCLGKQGMPDSEWIRGLLPLYEAASPKVKCNQLDPYPCIGCMFCTGGKTLDPHALLRLCVAVGWVCYRDRYVASCHAGGWAAKQALDAAEAWLKDPTEERLDAWEDACGPVQEEWAYLPCWIVSGTGKANSSTESLVVQCLQAAIKLIGRAALARCVEETLTVECDAFCGGTGKFGVAGPRPTEFVPQDCAHCEGTGRTAK